MDVVRVRLSDTWSALKAYRKDLHYSEQIDEEIQYALRALRAGKMVLQAIASIEKAGLNTVGLPCLAIARADREEVVFGKAGSRWVFEGPGAYRRAFNGRHDTDRVVMPAGAFKGLSGSTNGKALLPRIPATIKPKRGLENYYVLWEAEWEARPPKDPYLLRRIGKGDLWLVCGHWDLSPVEMAALSCRVGAA